MWAFQFIKYHFVNVRDYHKARFDSQHAGTPFCRYSKQPQVNLQVLNSKVISYFGYCGLMKAVILMAYLVKMPNPNACRTTSPGFDMSDISFFPSGFKRGSFKSSQYQA